MLPPSRLLMRYLHRLCNGNLKSGEPVGTRLLSTSAAKLSGHSRWSTIKHDKAKADARKNKHRSVLAQQIEFCSRMYGPDIESNPRLRTVIADAKRQGFPKESIETALKRGQGLSTTGKSLEYLTIDAVFPSGIAAIIECHTETKAKTLMEVRTILTKHSAQQSPVQYLFKKIGCITTKPLGQVSIDAVMECALEVDGFEDLMEVDDGIVALHSLPSATKWLADTISEKLGVEIDNLEISWQPLDYVVAPAEDVATVRDALERLEEMTEVRDVYLNIEPNAVDR